MFTHTFSETQEHRSMVRLAPIQVISLPVALMSLRLHTSLASLKSSMDWLSAALVNLLSVTLFSSPDVIFRIVSSVNKGLQLYYLPLLQYLQLYHCTPSNLATLII